jgi:alpha-glucoside transport system permease protein
MIINNKRFSALTLLSHCTVLIIVVLWTLPTAGLFISSIRDKNQLSVSGWWTSLSKSNQNLILRSVDPSEQQEKDGGYVMAGRLDIGEKAKVISFGWRAQEPDIFQPGEFAQMNDSSVLTVTEDGYYSIFSPHPFKRKRGRRIFVTAEIQPRFTLDNYREVLGARGIGRAFINSLSVTIPSTIIPVLIAAYAAYALAWMPFPGRPIFAAVIVGLLVVPLQIALIPLLQIYNQVGAFFGVSAKTYIGIWLAHTGFGLPLAIYLLKNYMVGLPGELIESAKMDGATDFDIFRRIILPLSFPALASFAIFQFLWVWNDLLVAMVFLGNNEDQLVLTGQLRELLGSCGGNWEILTAAAFVTIVVPLIVFFSLQRYLVRGLLAGSVKGG